jgi:hypothetical protein
MPNATRAACALVTSVLALSLPSHSGAQQDRNSPGVDAGATVVVVEFMATDLQIEGGAASAALELAQEPQLADLDISVVAVPDGSGDDDQRYDLDGALVFPAVEAFETWRDDRMQDYFAPVGGLSRLATSMRVFRPGLVAQAESGMGSGLEDVSITYRNTGNDSAGDSDIDAVTVICPGDHADCKPSN